MNIFVLHHNPVKAARLHCDKHVVKMILESAQMLSTAHRVLDKPDDDLLYRTTHVNHPCNVWVRRSSSNYEWLYRLFTALCDEYTRRYYKTHLTDRKLRERLHDAPDAIPVKTLTPFALCMPDEYKCVSPVKSYRNYYLSKANNMQLHWTRRKQPKWVTL